MAFCIPPAAPPDLKGQRAPTETGFVCLLASENPQRSSTLFNLVLSASRKSDKARGRKIESPTINAGLKIPISTLARESQSRGKKTKARYRQQRSASKMHNLVPERQSRARCAWLHRMKTTKVAKWCHPHVANAGNLQNCFAEK